MRGVIMVIKIIFCLNNKLKCETCCFGSNLFVAIISSVFHNVCPSINGKNFLTAFYPSSLKTYYFEISRAGLFKANDVVS